MRWNTAEQGSNSSMFLQRTHPAQKRLATPPGYTLLLYSNSGVISFTSLKNQISESAVRLESLTICRSRCKGNNFSSVILKTVSAGPAGVWTRDHPLNRGVLSQLS